MKGFCPMNKSDTKNFLLELLFFVLTAFLISFPYEAGTNIAYELLKILYDFSPTKDEDFFTHSVLTFAIAGIIVDIFWKKSINTNHMIPKKWNETSYQDIRKVILRYSLFIFVLAIFSFNFAFCLPFLKQKFSLTLPIAETIYLIIAISFLKYYVLLPLFYKKLSLSEAPLKHENLEASSASL